MSKQSFVIRPSVFSGPNIETNFDTDGYLGEVDTSKLFLKIDAGRSHLVVRIIDVNGKGDLRQEGPAMYGNHFDHTVDINKVQDSFCTKPGKNDVRLAIVSKAGHLTYAQYAIVSQDGKAWLIEQVKCEGQLYRDEKGNLSMVEDVRPELLRVLGEVTKIKKLDLPSATEMPTRAIEAGFPILSEGEGIVTWYDECRQVGAGRFSVDGRVVDAKIHYSQCSPRTKNGWKGFAKGERVRSAVIVPIDNPKSSFKYEAKGLTLSTPMPSLG